MMMEANKLKRSRPPPSPSGQPGSSSLSSSAVSSYENDTSANSAGEIYENRTEEEEDMANCLILLARGGCGDDSPPPPPPPPPHQKPSSRKFLNETAAGGFLLYECKTCSRTFSSFQALGGHRASHKKPLRSILVEENKKLPSMLSQASDDPIKAGKVHECSICGSEFSSGQALGGHMRRHRAAAASSNNSQIVNVNGFVKPPDEDRPRKIRRLDLNLPAPEDDLIREGKFQFVPISGKDLVFSAPPWAPWVDCHY